MSRPRNQRLRIARRQQAHQVQVDSPRSWREVPALMDGVARQLATMFDAGPLVNEDADPGASCDTCGRHAHGMASFDTADEPSWLLLIGVFCSSCLELPPADEA